MNRLVLGLCWPIYFCPPCFPVFRCWGKAFGHIKKGQQHKILLRSTSGLNDCYEIIFFPHHGTVCVGGYFWTHRPICSKNRRTCLLEFNRSTCQFFSGPSLLSSMEMAKTNPHGSMKRVMFWYRILIPHDKAAMMFYFGGTETGTSSAYHRTDLVLKMCWGLEDRKYLYMYSTYSTQVVLFNIFPVFDIQYP